MIASNVQDQSKSNKIDSLQSTPAISTAVPTADCVHSQIRERAFQIFESHGGKHGHDMQDWLRAERQIQTTN